jgi:capsular exopolysaccharide synthesis family protein
MLLVQELSKFTETKMKAGQYSQPSPLANTPQLNENDEGGLDLGQVLGAIRRKAFLIAGVTVVVASAAVYKAQSDTPVYQAKFEILTEPVTVETEVISSVPDTLSSQEKASTATIDETKIKILRSPRVLSSVVQQLQAKYPDISYGSLSSNLEIQASGNNILEVAYQHPERERVEDVLKLVAQAYLKYSLEDRQKDIRQGIDFVEEQLPQLQSRVETLQGGLQELRQQYNLVDPETTGQQLSTQIGTIRQQQTETQIQLNEARSVYTDLQRELANSSAESAANLALSENSRYQNILQQLQEIDTQIAQESVLFLEESPTIEVLREQRQNLLPLLSREGQRVTEEMASQIRALEAREQTLSQTAENLNQQVKQLSVISREYTDIRRELEIATENLNQFLSKREALRIDAAQREIPWQLLAPLGEPKPSSASVKNNLALGTILGLLLGMGAALVVDQFSKLLYTAKEVKDVTKAPLLGVIPLEKDLGELAPAVEAAAFDRDADNGSGLSNSYSPQRYRTALFREAFRSLCTNIRFLGSDRSIGSFVITSSVGEEGKSTIAAHLAQTAAAMGQRVLLVDTDLRHPSVHNQMGVMNAYGLTDIIATDMDLGNAIQRSPLEDNLFVLTAGPIPPDPIRLLASQKMQVLMEKLQETFDLVIYDAPPLLGFADASLLAAHTSGVVLVTGLGKLKRSDLEQALEKLRVSGIPVLGTVANGAKGSPSQVSAYYGQESRTRRFGESPATDALNSIPDLNFWHRT